MSLIGIILFITFVFLLIKAILETIWFCWILIQFAFLSVIEMMLRMAAAVVRLIEKPSSKSMSKRKSLKFQTKRQPAMLGAISFK